MTLSASQVLAWLVVAFALVLLVVASYAKKRANEARRTRAALAQSALDLAHVKAEHEAGKMNDEELSKELDRLLRPRNGSAPG